MNSFTMRGKHKQYRLTVQAQDDSTAHVMVTSQQKISFFLENYILRTGNKQNKPVNWGATVPRVSLENIKEATTADLYCSRISSTDALISSEAA